MILTNQKNTEKEKADCVELFSDLIRSLPWELSIYPSLCSPLDTKIWTGISINTCESVETLRSALAQLQDTLVKKLSQTLMKRIQQYAVDVTLDPNKAHPEMTLSEDGKQVRLGNIMHDYPHNYKRKWDLYPCPGNGNWCLWQSNGNMYKAGDSSPVSLSLNKKPQKVGVFVDYEEGLVSFDDVEASLMPLDGSSIE
ncbi:E3 ubiquitin-protein ligase TRIM39 [Pimephales promelas]|nr:E3 ubiquitin-protein ligase TRIM39 [Pimephales promelas]